MKITVNDLEAEIQKRFLFYTPTPKQASFHEAGATAVERLFLAGNRTGKTYCGCIEDAMHLTGRYPEWWVGHRFTHPIDLWVASESSKLVRNVMQPQFFGGYSEDNNYSSGLIHESLVVKKTMAGGGGIDYAIIKHVSGGHSHIYFKSYEQGREKFQAARCHLIHLDEEPPYDLYMECLIRLSDVDGKGVGRLILTMTPLKGQTEMTSYFMQSNSSIEEQQYIDAEVVTNGKYYIQASWDDNIYLSEDTKERLRKALKPHELEAREKGIPCIGTGMVYQVPESDFLIEPFEIPDHFTHVCGMDVGFNAPTAVVFLAHDRDTDTIYVYKDYSVREQTPAQHANSLLMMGLDWIPTVCDPSVNQGLQLDGSKLIEHYEKAGLKLIKGKYAKELAITEVINRIRVGQFKVFNTCRKFMDEWRAYSRDGKGKPIKRNDHLMNALEFVMLDGLAIAKNKRSYLMRNNYNSHPGYF